MQERIDKFINNLVMLWELRWALRKVQAEYYRGPRTEKFHFCVLFLILLTLDKLLHITLQFPHVENMLLFYKSEGEAMRAGAKISLKALGFYSCRVQHIFNLKSAWDVESR
jgi:hypothetical protein